MTAVNRPWTIEQGASFREDFQWCTNAGTVEEPVAGLGIDLTGYTARMQVRAMQHSPVLINATTENGLIVLGVDPSSSGTPDLTTGWISVILTSEDTDLLDRKTLFYDLELVASDGWVTRIIEGKITVKPNITQVDLDDPVVAE